MLRGTLIMAALVWIADPAGAFTCRLIVDGQTYGDGPCNYQEDADGSFRFDYPSDPRMFVYVSRNPDGTAQGYWPGPQGGSHAHDNLGQLSRNGACWENTAASVCAWR
jgi:hypothetical protein